GSELELIPSPCCVRTLTEPVSTPKGTVTESCVDDAELISASVPAIRTVLSAGLPENPDPLIVSVWLASTFGDPKLETVGMTLPGAPAISISPRFDEPKPVAVTEMSILPRPIRLRGISRLI